VVAPVVDPRLAELQHKCEELQAELARLNEQRAKLNAAYSNLCMEVTRARESLDVVGRAKADLERQLSDLKEILQQKLKDLETAANYRNYMEAEMTTLRNDNAQLRRELADAQGVAMPVISSDEALAHYIHQHEAQLQIEAKEALQKQLSEGAYIDIIRNDPHVLRMLQLDLPGAIREWNTANTSGYRQVD
jgi:chromosome segregation ATPase